MAQLILLVGSEAGRRSAVEDRMQLAQFHGDRVRQPFVLLREIGGAAGEQRKQRDGEERKGSIR
jgi:hypothetical protein